MNSERKFILLVLGIPLVGLLYCGLGIAIMASSSNVREHPLTSGAVFILLPNFIILGKFDNAIAFSQHNWRSHIVKNLK